MCADRVAVTGATGFIGGALVRRLVATGTRVRSLVRPESAHKLLPVEVEKVVGSLTDRAALETLLDSADAVVHCAGSVRGAEASAFMHTNATATSELAELAIEANVGRFILLSSLAATRPEISPYAASKRAAESALQGTFDRIESIVLRPPAVYGPGDRELLPLFKAMAAGIAPLWGNPAAKFSLIYVDDLVGAVLRCLEVPAAGGAIFELHDGRPDGYSMAEVIDIGQSVFKRRIRRCRIPAPLLDVAARMNLLMARFLTYDPMLTPWKLRELRYPRWVCDNTALHAATGWTPQISLAQGLPLTLHNHRGTN